MINTFDHEDGEALLECFRRRLQRMTFAIDEARARNVPVLYVNDAAGRWDGAAPAHVRDAVERGRGGDVVRAIAPHPGDAFVFKPRYSAFDRTPLAHILHEQQIDRVLLTGAATEGCVVQSAIDGRELGFKVTIVSDACATTDPELERIALAYAERVGGIRLG